MSVLCAWVRGMPRMARIIALIGLIIVLIGMHVYDKQSGITKAVQEVHQSYTVASQQIALKAKEEHARLLTEQWKEQERRDEKIKSLSVKLAAANRLLNSRTERPKDGGESPVVTTSCTGRELYREDGEFLIREAARADKVIIERDYYYEQYENARKMIKRINDEQKAE